MQAAAPASAKKGPGKGSNLRKADSCDCPDIVACLLKHLLLMAKVRTGCSAIERRCVHTNEQRLKYTQKPHQKLSWWRFWGGANRSGKSKPKC